MKSDPNINEFFYIFAEDLGEYEEYTKHPIKGFLYEVFLKKELEEKFQAMYEKRIE